MKPHLSAVILAATLAGCAACANDHDEGAESSLSHAPRAASPLKEPVLIRDVPMEAPAIERKSKTQSQ